MPNYRDRIYANYVHGRQQSLAPKSVADFGSAPYLRRLVRDHFPPRKDAAILDLGCGHGALLHFAQELGYTNTSGVDWSQEQVAEATRLGIKGVVKGDLVANLANTASDSIDVLIAFDVIEHFRKDELIVFVDHALRVLRRDGVFIVHVPNGESPFVGRILYGDLTHESAFTRISIAQLLKSSGFSTIECFEDAPVVHGLKSAIRRALWILLRSAIRVYLTVETGRGDGIFTQNVLAVARR